MILIVLICLILTAWWVLKTRKEMETQPPGPFPLPIIGTLHHMIWPKIIQRKLVGQALQEFTAKYGPVATFHFGHPIVVIEDYELLKEVFYSEQWTGRHFDAWFGERSFGKPYGLLFSSGEEWKEMRRFTLRALRDFGFGKYSSQESVAEEELAELISRLDHKIETKGPIIQMKQFFTISVLNILWSLITGQRFSHDDDKLKRFNRSTTRIVKIASLGDNLSNAFPILRYLYLPFIKTRIIEMQDYFREMLVEKRKLQDYKNEQRDFVEVFLKEMDNHANKSPNYYTEEQFIVLLLDLFMAGSETTANTLEFAILYMILNPDVQARVQEEIDSVIGTSRFPTMTDKSKMPYTEATLLEVQRISNVLPIDSHSNTIDYELGGYKIPKGTPVVMNLYGLHMNPKLWNQPHVFNPSRFLDSENNLVNVNKVLPFGVGKRVCIGEPMARFTIFVYFTALLQKYSFRQVPGSSKPPTTDAVTGVTLSPRPYKALVEHR